jgi:glycerol-3-phosphate acyltransferase PlsY
VIWAILSGFAIGSIPSADLIGRIRGYDLRSSGSGNPGTANALRVAGRGTALIVLALDLAKGAAAALAGWAIASDAGALAGGVSAVAGQIANPWFGFRGGKGLGVTGGVTLALWPPGALLVLPVVALGAKLLRSAGGALAGLTAYLVGTVVWAANSWPTWWGVPADDHLVWAGIGIFALAAPKFVRDLARTAID